MSGYQMNFNQDFTSISVLNKNGFRLFSITSNEKVEEIFAKDNEQIRIVERLFNSSLVVLVTVQKPNCLRMLHFKKKQDICNCVYPTDILCVRMNRQRLIVCLVESIHIHDIRDMKILHSIVTIAPNELGLCTLSLNSHLAFPISSIRGELRIFNANKLRPELTVQAHETALSALSFSPNGLLLATASERGTVIRVFCVKNGQRVQEFRRGVKRCVRIASLVFSSTGDFLCVSSNTETVHIFKVNVSAVEAAERKSNVQEASEDASSKQASAAEVITESLPAKLEAGGESASSATASSSVGSWSGYLTNAVSSYLIPSQVSDVLAQYRAFASATLAQPGFKHVIGLARVQKQLQLLIACEDGFLYIHDFSTEHGGPCKLLRMHDLRCALEGVVELNLTESIEKVTLSATTTTTTTTTPTTTNSTAADTTAVTVINNSRTKEAILKQPAGISSVLIENPDPAPDNSYAGILKGEQAANNLTVSNGVEERLEKVEHKLDNMEAEIKKMSLLICKHNLLMEELLKTMSSPKFVFDFFPISSLAEMKVAEEAVFGQEEEVTKYLKSKFMKREMKAILKEIFSDKYILSINWDGTKTKVAAKEYKIFNYCLFDALKDNFSNYADYEKAMKNAFKEAKFSFHREAYKIKNTT